MSAGAGQGPHGAWPRGRGDVSGRPTRRPGRLCNGFALPRRPKDLLSAGKAELGAGVCSGVWEPCTGGSLGPPEEFPGLACQRPTGASPPSTPLPPVAAASWHQVAGQLGRVTLGLPALPWVGREPRPGQPEVPPHVQSQPELSGCFPPPPACRRATHTASSALPPPHSWWGCPSHPLPGCLEGLPGSRYGAPSREDSREEGHCDCFARPGSIPGSL